MQDLIEEMKAEIISKIQERVKRDIRPQVDEIVNQEVAAFGLRLSTHIEVSSMTDKIVIEIKRSRAEVENNGG